MIDTSEGMSRPVGAVLSFVTSYLYQNHIPALIFRGAAVILREKPVVLPCFQPLAWPQPVVAAAYASFVDGLDVSEIARV